MVQSAFELGNVKLEVFGFDTRNEEIIDIANIEELVENVFVSVRVDGDWIDAGTLDCFDTDNMTSDEVVALENSDLGIQSWLESLMSTIEDLRKERDEQEALQELYQDEAEESFDREDARIHALNTYKTISWELLAQRHYPKCQNIEVLVDIMQDNYLDGGILYRDGISADNIYAAVVAHYRHNHTDYDDEFILREDRPDIRREFNSVVRNEVRQFLGMEA
ncbi:DUF2293 domain-containing protein [Alicyclobacillus acidoterrestris]|uniref:DUF2293 domain-containing protein n=1 Tax=Alicyclobacillus acidoterrestris (strain ATCC 49025 / DSM 3922 / CIP 106132 / NCIMB 13137 / GD3B) TaxID=1356854 RepID=T0DDG3_ALIAG|nr:DUF2293 domain-containing protein [Alicyclobacillus acidoterrestris]EPZ47701.1 hypothetical protein N007_05455 [Alicyclobacillus acidoterrestris ATCC 49025]UNO47984.1 DUF2293 domain-containing protein [Alicyclobacillus acidoterrestris]